MFAFEGTIKRDNISVDIWSPLVGRFYYKVMMPLDFNKQINNLPVITEVNKLIGKHPVIVVTGTDSAVGVNTTEEGILEIINNKLYDTSG